MTGRRIVKQKEAQAAGPKTLPAEQLEVLDGFDLTPGHKVRFQLYAGRDSWSEGTVQGVNRDGSLDLYDTKKGQTRAIGVDRIEAERRGPRGGKHWVPLVPKGVNA